MTFNKRQEVHLDVAEAFFVYLDFGIDDERARRDQERKMWLEILHSEMTDSEFEEINCTNQDEHFLPLKECEASGHMARGSSCSKNDSGIRTVIVHRAPATGRKPRLL